MRFRWVEGICAMPGSRIEGTGGHVFVTDRHLSNAHLKLVTMCLEITDAGCWIAPPGADNMPARFMVDGETDLARRWSWRIHNGPIPEGHRIYMSCCTYDCVNPLHMYAYKAGEENRPRRIVRPNAKLTWEIVEKMRKIENPDVSLLSYLHDVHPSTIRAILQGKTWIKK